MNALIAGRHRLGLKMANVIIPIMALPRAVGRGRAIQDVLGASRQRLGIGVTFVIIPIISPRQACILRETIIYILRAGRAGRGNIILDGTNVPDVPPLILYII